MEDLELEAEELESAYPRCKDAIRSELARIKERGRMGEFQGVDISEILISFRTKIERLACAQKRLSGPTKVRLRRRRR